MRKIIFISVTLVTTPVFAETLDCYYFSGTKYPSGSIVITEGKAKFLNWYGVQGVSQEYPTKYSGRRILIDRNDLENKIITDRSDVDTIGANILVLKKKFLSKKYRIDFGSRSYSREDYCVVRLPNFEE